MIYNLNFFTQYGQFYVVDKGTDGETDDLEFWSDAALLERLACENGILGILIENDYCTVMGGFGNIKQSTSERRSKC